MVVSADYLTQNFVGYSHDKYVAVFWRNLDEWGGGELAPLTPELVRELQSITDQWKASHERR